jgi:hypothetical protein
MTTQIGSSKVGAGRSAPWGAVGFTIDVLRVAAAGRDVRAFLDFILRDRTCKGTTWAMGDGV